MDHKRAEEVAANRLQIISPLLDPVLDKAKRQDLKEAASIQFGISERTIRRWVSSYEAKGFEGLKPKAPETAGSSKIPEDLIQEAIRLRREVPKRSIPEIIRILEWEGLAEEGFLRKSTLQDQLAKALPEALAQLSVAVGYQVRHLYRRTADLHGLLPR